MLSRRGCLLMLAGAPVLHAGVRAMPAGPRTGFDTLIGGWSRVDGNYHIVVRAVGADGALQAMYFNPNPLPFALARARREAGAVLAHFELQAGGYAGSTYDLRLIADKDRLVGSYYRAVTKQSFEVEFLRR